MKSARLLLTPERLRLLLYAVQEVKGRTPEESYDLDKLWCTLNDLTGGIPSRPVKPKPAPKPRGAPTVEARISELARGHGVSVHRRGKAHFYIRLDAGPKRIISDQYPWPTHADLSDPAWVGCFTAEVGAMTMKAKQVS